MIRDYTSVLANEKGIGRRKSVEFDLALRPQQMSSHQMLPPVPQPRKAQRGGPGEQLYQNHQSRQWQIQQHLYQQQQQQQMRRSRPLSILYKPPPQIIMTEAEQV